MQHKSDLNIPNIDSREYEKFLQENKEEIEQLYQRLITFNREELAEWFNSLRTLNKEIII